MIKIATESKVFALKKRKKIVLSMKCSETKLPIARI